MKEYKSYDKDAIFHELMWSFFKPIIIGWGSFALIAWVVLSLR